MKSARVSVWFAILGCLSWIHPKWNLVSALPTPYLERESIVPSASLCGEKGCRTDLQFYRHDIKHYFPRPAYHITQTNVYEAPTSNLLMNSRNNPAPKFLAPGKAFVVDVSCQLYSSSPPYELDPDHPECSQAIATIQLAVTELNKVLNLVRPIRVSVEYYNFCGQPGPGGVAPQDCQDRDTLGQGGPMAFWSWEENTPPNITTSALLFASNSSNSYMYPQSLMKQLVTSPARYEWADYDIFLKMNGDRNGRAAEGVPKFYYKSNGGDIQSGQYDFEYVATHEMVHGLGFLSSWGNYFTDSSGNPLPLLTPYPGDSDTTLNLQNSSSSLSLSYFSFNSQYVFDKFLFSGKYGQFLNEYVADNLLQDFVSVATKAGGVVLADGSQEINWGQVEAQSPGYQLYDSAVTDLGIQFYVPSMESFVYLDTSFNPFAAGSSISHTDGTIYANLKDFLMRPRTFAGETLEMKEQLSGSTKAVGPCTVGILNTLGFNTKSPFTIQDFRVDTSSALVASQVQFLIQGFSVLSVIAFTF